MTNAPAFSTRDRLTLQGRLNQECFCIDVDPAHVWRAVEQITAGIVPGEVLARDRAHLFSKVPVFLSQADLIAMSEVVQAVEALGQFKPFQTEALAWAPEIARIDFGPRGAFMGYDFHLTPNGPKLIEVNTNAGGAFLNAILAQAWVACCPEAQAFPPQPPAKFEDAVWNMFEAEWRLQRGAGRPRVIAIVDDAPEGQYLYPEFLLAQAFFERRGVEAVIADPKSLRFWRGRLMLGEQPIDLVYNRLVDFAFESPAVAALREAYLADAVVVTPNPRNHALLADKRNLALLSDPAWLETLGVEQGLRDTLARLPRARLVTPDNAAALWAERKSLFFKPAGAMPAKPSTAETSSHEPSGRTSCRVITSPRPSPPRASGGFKSRAIRRSARWMCDSTPMRAPRSWRRRACTRGKPPTSARRAGDSPRSSPLADLRSAPS